MWQRKVRPDVREMRRFEGLKCHVRELDVPEVLLQLKQHQTGDFKWKSAGECGERYEYGRIRRAYGNESGHDNQI
jgi:hypothetical protein